MNMTLTFRQKRTLLRMGIKRADGLITDARRFMDTLNLGTCDICKKARTYKTSYFTCAEVCSKTAIQHLCFQLSGLDTITSNYIFARINKLQEGKQTLLTALENLETRYYERKVAIKIKKSNGGII